MNRQEMEERKRDLYIRFSEEVKADLRQSNFFAPISFPLLERNVLHSLDEELMREEREECCFHVGHSHPYTLFLSFCHQQERKREEESESERAREKER
jgi:hypothetical protein